MMDATDRAIVNQLQGGFPIAERPYAEAAQALGLDEDELIKRIDNLLARGVLSRFGPMFNADRMGGAFTLAAMRVPDADFASVAAKVNAHPEVAHNYARDHVFNMWFVVATERPEDVAKVLAAIAAETRLEVYDFPKLDEFYVGLRLDA